MGYDMYIEETPDAKERPGVSENDLAYFRLNIWGMGRFRNLMDTGGMLDWDAEPPHGATGEAFSDFTLEEPKGIPGIKFTSNDGWLVTPDEIRAALAQLEGSGNADVIREDAGEGDIDYWLAWIHYLQVAERHGGFRVW